jgi:DNA invertase Pin-like site-specific DNA recombinase
VTLTAYSYLRFSTPRQQWGDSQRRQATNSTAYCERKKLDLDTAIKFYDKGVSGFHSKNLTEGALGRFLTAVKEKTIKTPCALVVESLDRLSRDTLDEAFFLFLDLIRAGVEIHTLNPEVQYTRQSVKENPAHIMLAVNDLWRANRESETKSYRSRENWVRKRQTAADKVMTTKVPHWLEVVDGSIRVKPGAEKTVLLMVRLALDGLGGKRIAQRLNKDGIPPFTNFYVRHLEDKEVVYRKPVWDSCYVMSVLRSRALVGEFTPYVRTSTGREKTGTAIPNYYPRLLTPAVFNRLQIAISARKGKIGRDSDKVSNLFKGLLHDAIDKGTYYCNCKGYTAFLVNRNGAFGKGDYRSIRYKEFEQAFCQFIEIVVLTPTEADNSHVYEAALADIDTRIAKTKQAIAKHPKFSSLLDTLVMLETRRAETVLLLDAERNKTPVQEALKDTKRLARVPEDTENRLRLRQRIAELVDSMWLLNTDNGRQKSAKIVHCHCQVFFKNGDRREFRCFTRRSGGTVATSHMDEPKYDLRNYDPKTYRKAYLTGGMMPDEAGFSALDMFKELGDAWE